jgi:adenylate cyclase
MPTTRRLAAILVEVDEQHTQQRLKVRRRELVYPSMAQHHCRIVKSTGDGLLVEFPSVVDAVRCAVAAQQAKPHELSCCLPISSNE